MGRTRMTVLARFRADLASMEPGKSYTFSAYCEYFESANGSLVVMTKYNLAKARADHRRFHVMFSEYDQRIVIIPAPPEGVAAAAQRARREEERQRRDEERQSATDLVGNIDTDCQSPSVKPLD